MSELLAKRLAVGAGVAIFLLGARDPAWAASAEDCGEFHRECREARAAGYHDVGICNVERLECPSDEDPAAPERSPEVRDDDGDDPERSFGERSVGP